MHALRVAPDRGGDRSYGRGQRQCMRHDTEAVLGGAGADTRRTTSSTISPFARMVLDRPMGAAFMVAAGVGRVGPTTDRLAFLAT